MSGWEVKFEAQQAVTDPVTGEVLVEPGDLSDDPKVLDAADSVYKPIAVKKEDKPKAAAAVKEDKDEKDDAPKPHPHSVTKKD